MRSLMIVCVVVCVALMAGVANAASGEISDSSLAQMGLNGMQTMSDVQGTEVRGMGFAWVKGISYASVGGVGSVNSYGAKSYSSMWSSALAAGASGAGVGTGYVTVLPDGTTFGSVTGFVAIGGGVAYAK